MAKPISPNKSAKLKKSSSPWDRAVRYLGFRPRSEKEMRDYLGPDCTEEIIARLKELKFIDDREFARWYIEQRSRFRPRSRRLLTFELKRKGIDAELSDQSPLTDKQLAEAALAKKMRVWALLPYPEFKVKAVRFLASRGFNWDIIAEVVKKGYNHDNVS